MPASRRDRNVVAGGRLGRIAKGTPTPYCPTGSERTRVVVTMDADCREAPPGHKLWSALIVAPPTDRLARFCDGARELITRADRRVASCWRLVVVTPADGLAAFGQGAGMEIVGAHRNVTAGWRVRGRAPVEPGSPAHQLARLHDGAGVVVARADRQVAVGVGDRVGAVAGEGVGVVVGDAVTAGATGVGVSVSGSAVAGVVAAGVATAGVGAGVRSGVGDGLT